MADKELTKKTQTAVTRRQQPQKRPTFVPATDIWETPEAIVLQLDMPGVATEGLEVHVKHGTLTVHGKVADEHGEKLMYAEQRIGDFHREFALSDDLDNEAITAKMHAGVLTLTVAKAEKVKPRRIAITAG